MHNSTRLQTMARKLREEQGNCFLYGCVTLVILTVLAGLISYLAVRNFAKQMSEKYTEPTAVALPTATLPPAETEALIARVDDYAAKLRAGDALGTLTLTQDELNALIQNHPDLKDDFGSIVYLTLGENDATGQMSIALDWIPGFRGRFFNGTATFDFEVRDGRAELFLTGATVKGESVPEQFIVTVGGENIATDWQRNNPDARLLLEKVESVKIESGTVVITPANLATLEPVMPIESEGASGEQAPESPPADTPAAEPAPPAN